MVEEGSFDFQLRFYCHFLLNLNGVLELSLLVKLRPKGNSFSQVCSLSQQIYHTTLQYCYHVWAVVPSCYFDMLDELQKRVRRTFGLTLATSRKPLVYCRNNASFILFHRYNFVRCSSELAELVPLLDCLGRSIILIDWMSSLSHYLDVTRVLASTVSFFAQPPDSGIICLQNTFLDVWCKWRKV